MRLDRVYIDGFKNLIDFEIDFDEDRLTTVVIGQNGTGKSNLVEAITDVFRWVDLNRGEPRFRYEIDYRIGRHRVRLTNRNSRASIMVDGQYLARNLFERSKPDLFPDLIFGYYSGTSRRMESLFDSHQRRYYSEIIKEDNDEGFSGALAERRLFYCRPIHGVFALLSFFAFPEPAITKLLEQKLGIVGFHSGLAHFKEPSWFTAGKWTRGREAHAAIGARGRRSYSLLSEQADDLWGATGMAGECARALRDIAFLPLPLQDSVIDDYRAKQRTESQFACFMRSPSALSQFASRFVSDQDMFAALEAVDISDLIRAFPVWVTRKHDSTGDVGFDDLSDGERQLLMVLGLIRVSRGKRALFLLDEPDTHLNPLWQHTYLDLIREWTGVATDENKCHIVMTSHNPLTIAALEKREVRVLNVNSEGSAVSTVPYADPRGMGFTATLTEIFGLPTTLDTHTQRLVDQRNLLAKIDNRTEDQDAELIDLNDQLNRLGFMLEDREPLYQDFLRAWSDVKYADRPVMTPEEANARAKAMRGLIATLLKQSETHR